MTNSEAVINFMYFGNNYPHDFIYMVWSGHIRVHLTSKFIGMYGKHGTQTFFKWFMELDAENKEILINWINANYTG